jgi:outer membrane receptor protein involved in Fe transport
MRFVIGAKKGVVFGLFLATVLSKTALAQDPVLTSSPAGSAETSSQKKVSAEAEGTTEVTVTGKKDGNKIDRQVYDVSKEASDQNASVADTLKKIPGVDVDNNGDVTLRGKRVVVYINGRPSLLLSGDNRGLALKAMPSKLISKVEIISNPSAQFGAEGSGGIINLVTNAALPPGRFGNETIKLDSAGGYQPNIFEAVSTDKLTLMGFVAFNRNEIANHNDQNLQQFGGTGDPETFSQSNTSINGHMEVPLMFGTLEYKLGKDDVLNGQVNVYKGKFYSYIKGDSANYTSKMVPTSDIDLRGMINSEFENESISVSWLHYGKKADETLRLSADLSNNVNATDTSNYLFFKQSTSSELAGTTQQTDLNGRSTARKAILSLDYNTPVGDDQLSSGLQLTHDENESVNYNFGPGPAGSELVVNQNLSQFFRWKQNLFAAYATYQKEIGEKWTILGGLRAETLVLNTHQLITGEVNAINYTRLTPSFFATYIFSPQEKFRFNFSQRLERPSASDLSSNLIYSDLNHVFRGNPSLKPQITNGFEISDEYTRDNINRSIRLFFKQDTQLISTLSSIVPDPQNLGNVVIETTRVNQGIANTAGIDVYYSTKLSPSLKLDADIIVSKSRITTSTWPQGRSVNSVGAKIGLSYSTKRNDQLKIDFALTGKTLTPQGYTGSHSSTNFQFTHNITPQVQITLGGSDIFKTARTKTVIQTPLIYSQNTSEERAPLYYVTITRNFFTFFQPNH